MATKDGNICDAIAVETTDGGEFGNGAKGRFVVWSGAVQLLDQHVTRYLLAAYDSGLPGRRFWVDTEISTRLAPTPSGSYGLLYVLALINNDS